MVSKKDALGKRAVYFLGYLLLIPSMLFNIYLWSRLSQSQAEQSTFKVVKVIDGDTIILEGDQSIRLASINAPETEFCLGKEAKKRLEDLVLGKRIKLEVTSRESYNRMIGLVSLRDTLINQIMLEEGLSRYDSSGIKQDEILLPAANRAREAKIGVYSEKCTQTKPPNPQCLIKGNADKHSSKKLYHFPGCSGYSIVVVEKDRGENWFCSEKEAENQGFIKSEQCFGKVFRK